MDEERRRRYLSAMGVAVWELRPGREPGGETSSGAQPPRPEPAPDAGPGQEEAALALSKPLGAVVTGADQAESGTMDRASRVARMDWGELRAAVAACRDCGLCETRTQTVFGVGDQEADLMVIGEAPGADEDREGEPFVGRAGQLLNRMLAAIGFAREQVYIANVLKCRPPGNRDPSAEESLRCEAYLIRQVDLVRPRIILAVGRIAAQHLLRTDVSVGRLRGRWFELGQPGVPLRVTYHPAYLLRSPEQKAKAWEDLTAVKRRLDGMGTSSASSG